MACHQRLGVDRIQKEVPMKGVLIAGGAMVLVLSAFPAVAEPPSTAPNLLAAILYPVLAPEIEACAEPAATPSDLNMLADCTARCQDGSTRTCSGSSCFAVDASCPSERGYCWGSSTGTIQCPACSGGCTCQQGAQCTSDASCNCNETNPGVCVKGESDIVGWCSC